MSERGKMQPNHSPRDLHDPRGQPVAGRATLPRRRYEAAREAFGAARSFSQGLLCRLSLARAFVKKSSILLLDDSHNGLSQAGDAALTAHLNALRGNTTVLLVNARPSHMRVDERVMVKSAGVVTASGKPDAIIPNIVECIASNAA